MKRFLRVLKWIGMAVLAIVLILGIVYFFGPRMSMEPINNNPIDNFQVSLEELDQYIAQKEETIKGLKEGNQARVIWADSLPRQTEYSIVYLHGFSASSMESGTTPQKLARYFGANLYLSRLHEHGIKREDAMVNLNPKDYIESAKEAIAIGKQLGKKVILLSCSTGGTLSLYLAANDPEIEGLIALSSNTALANPSSFILTGPWGLQIARLLMGKNRSWATTDERVKQYWTTRYRTEALVQLQLLIEATMNKETFQAVKQPIFVGYYYKNEKEQDQVISVPSLLKMYEQLGTPESKKQKIAFPKTGNHIMCSPWHSKDIEGVEQAIINFMQEILGMTKIS